MRSWRVEVLWGTQSELLRSHVAVLRPTGTAGGHTRSQVVNAELTLATDVTSLVSMLEGKPEARIWPHKESEGKNTKKMVYNCAHSIPAAHVGN